jgi:hypothetical protein
VDAAALLELSRQIRSSAAEAASLTKDPTGLRIAAGELGSSEVAEALALFAGAWHSALCDAVEGANRMAEAVRLVARDYDDAERLVDGLFLW